MQKIADAAEEGGPLNQYYLKVELDPIIKCWNWMTVIQRIFSLKCCLEIYRVGWSNPASATLFSVFPTSRPSQYDKYAETCLQAGCVVFIAVLANYF